MSKEHRKYMCSLRHYIAIVCSATLIFSWVISIVLVIIGVKIFYHGEFTNGVLGVLGLLVFVISIAVGGFGIWKGAGHLTKPLLEVNDAVKQVAEGNFKVKIERRDMTGRNYTYSNEIDELSKNVNKMTEELDSMEYMRKDFMSNVSHEIKTPIAAITGFTEILLDSSICEKERQEYLEVINEESMRLSRLCENMLCMSRLDSQVLVTNNERIRLDEQIRKCIILLGEKWYDKDIDFTIDLDKIEIVSDGDMLQQVWINLIDNAIKYSSKNCSINITARKVSDEFVEVMIKDNGIGIATNKLNKIFEKFYQCEESHKKSGNGLGLSIVNRIIELLNGSIQCESIEGTGTSMVVRLPEKNNFY